MTETWKPILGWEGIYQVSDLGRVKTLSRIVKRRNGGVQLLPERIRVGNTYGKYGYPVLGLKDKVSGRMESALVNRLVAMAFIPNPDNKPEVNHKDGVKTNNRADNLEWATHLENMQHAAQSGLMRSGDVIKKCAVTGRFI